MENNNIRTMEYLGEDDWGNYVYKCIETSVLYKGEMCYPIKKEFEIKFLKRENFVPKSLKFNYMMLDRLKMDCDYYLGNGNRYNKHLWAGDEQKQIDEMKKLYNSFTDEDKPEWLTWDNILQYEKLMIN